MVDIHSLYELIRPIGTKSPWVKSDRIWLKSMPKTIPRTLRYPEVPLCEVLDQATEKFRNHLLVCFIPEDTKYTYGEAKWITDKLSLALSKRFDIGKGKAVAIITRNRPEYIFAQYGILKTGAACVPINPLLTASDVEYVVKKAGIIDTMFIHDQIYPMLGDDLRKAGIKNFIILGEKEFPDTVGFWSFIKEYPARQPRVDINPKEDLASIMYTGGTTGLPKGVMLTHYNLLSDALLTTYTTKIRPESVAATFGRELSLMILPICHAYGFMMSTIYVYLGATMIMFDRFNEKETLEAIEKYRITWFEGVPTMYMRLLNYPDIEKYDISSLETCACGGAAIAPEIAKRWEELTGVRLNPGYGCTECSSIAISNPYWSPQLIKIESIGIPLIDTDAKIIDPDTGEELPPGKEGELIISGPQVMKGFWRDPEKTAEAFWMDPKTGEKWVHTGDIVKMDEEGYFYIVGRTKEMIKYKAYRLFPFDIEEKLYKHPAIGECAVIGVPDPQVGEQIKAFVVLKPEHKGKITKEEIITWAKKHIGPIKYPRIIELRDQLPKTPVGKIFRRKLRKEEEKKA